MLKTSLFYLVLLAGCSAQLTSIEAEEQNFLSRLNVLWQAAGDENVNGPARLSIQSLTVHEGGKKVIVNIQQRGAPEVQGLTFFLESVRDINGGYFTNTIHPEPGVAVTRFVGLKLSNRSLYWQDHDPEPIETPPQGSDQAVWDAFNAKYWTKDKVSFTIDYVLLGREI